MAPASNGPSRSLRVSLGLLQVLVSVGAVPAGIGLVTDPSGGNLGLPPAWVADSVFGTYLVPGIVLLTVNGIGSLVGAVLTFTRHRLAGTVAALLGIFLVAWIGVQMSVIPYSVLQPLYVAVGLVELFLGLRLRARQQAASAAT